LFYDRNILQEAGIETPPAMLDNLVADAAKIGVKDNGPISQRWI